jgi:hypothetical protein
MPNRGDVAPFVLNEKFLTLNSKGTSPGLKTWLLRGVLRSRIASGKNERESIGVKVTGRIGTSGKLAVGISAFGDSLVSFGPEEQEVTHKLTISTEIWILFMESHQMSLKIFIFKEFKGSIT